MSNRTGLENVVISRLVAAYKKNPVKVTQACDDLIDPSGNLLGWIRDLARTESPADTPGPVVNDVDDLRARVINLERYVFGMISGGTWHEIEYPTSGLRLGKLGALVFLIDADGHPVSRGYHKITHLGFDRYEGQLGARREEFYLTGDRRTLGRGEYE